MTKARLLFAATFIVGASLIGACAQGGMDGEPLDESGGHKPRTHGGNTVGDDAGGDPAPPPPPDPTSDASPPPPPNPYADSGGGAPPAPDDSGHAPWPESDAGPPSSPDTGPASVDSGPPAPTEYPAGPYGFSVGSTFPNVSFSGYRNGTGAWVTITMRDYYDPSGARHINGIWLDVSAGWCGACRAEAGDLPGLYSSTYKARGGQILTALIQDDGSAPASKSAVDAWIKDYAVNFDIFADPSSDTLPKTSIGLPHNYAIDPRTMKVMKVIEGSDSGATSIPALDTILSKNGA